MGRKTKSRPHVLARITGAKRADIRPGVEPEQLYVELEIEDEGAIGDMLWAIGTYYGFQSEYRGALQYLIGTDEGRAKLGRIATEMAAAQILREAGVGKD